MGKRFSFGRNWQEFARSVAAPELHAAQQDLGSLLGENAYRLRGARVLDIGCGSGLQAVAMAAMGARSVVALDVDADCVSTARDLAVRLAPHADIRVDHASVLDGAYMASLGRFDLVHAWGSLHHTGRMWEAVAAAASTVAPGGCMVLALYNRTAATPAWSVAKAAYTRLNAPAQWVATAAWFGARVTVRLLRGKSLSFLDRGMHLWTDARDWLGGYPYEAAVPADVVKHVLAQGLSLERKQWTRTLGCNQFVFVRSP